MSIFQDIVAGIRVLTDVRLWKALPPLLKKYGIKTPVFHAPADFHGFISQPVKKPFCFLQAIMGRMRWIHGNVLDKAQYGNTVFPIVVRVKQTLFCNFFKGLCNGHPGCGQGKAIEAAHGEGAEKRHPADGDPFRHAIGNAMPPCSGSQSG